VIGGIHSSPLLASNIRLLWVVGFAR